MRVVIRQSGDGENPVETEKRSMRGAGGFEVGGEGAVRRVEAAYVCWHGGVHVLEGEFGFESSLI